LVTIYKGRLHDREQGASVEGLGEKSGRAGPERPRASFLVIVSREDDDGRSAAIPGQSSLELRAAHARQAQVEHQASSTPPGGRSEELLGRGENRHRESAGAQEALDGQTNRFVIVDDGDDALLAHVLRTVRRARRAA